MPKPTIYNKEIWLLAPGVPVVTQGGEQSCVGNGTSRAVTHMERRSNPSSTRIFNRHQAWWDGRAERNMQNYNTGCSLSDMAKALAKRGLSTLDWDNAGNYAWEPPPDVRADALTNKPIVMKQMPYIKGGPNKDDVHESIAYWLDKGYLVLASVVLSHNSDGFFYQSGTPGEIDTWVWRHDITDGNLEEHCVPIFGRSYDKGLYYYLNSWGPGFGVNGCAAMPFDKVEHGFQRCVFDLAVITEIKGVQAVPVSPTPQLPPTVLSDPQLTDFYNRLRAKLVEAAGADADNNGLPDSWQGALNKMAELGGSDKLFELLVPLPRFTVRDQVNAGSIVAPPGLTFEQDP